MTGILFSSSPNRSDYKNEFERTLILDLDETLVHSWEDPHFVENYQIYSRPDLYRQFHPRGSQSLAYSMHLHMPHGDTEIWGLYRPHLYDFLKFIDEYFDNVLVWSAGVCPYVEEITRQMYSNSDLRFPKLIWSRDRCSSYQGYYHKPISEIIADLGRYHYPVFDVDPRSTFIIDDKVHTFMENPQNGILIPPFYPGKSRPGRIPTMKDLTDRSDRALIDIKEWFEQDEVRNSTDFRKLDTSRIF